MTESIVIKGNDSLLQLYELAKKNIWKKIFIVTGKKSFKATGAEEKILRLFSSEQVSFFNDFETNPKFNDVIKGIKQFNESNADVIVSIGGGSVIDMAKLINSLAPVKLGLEDYITGKVEISKVAVPFVAVPTTSGSGSEATHFAVVYYENEKYSLANELLLPTIVILDPYLTRSLPPYITSYTAMDALCQAMESFWSVNSTIESSEYSLKAIQMLLDNIHDVVNSPGIQNRKAVQEAAYLAGKAINITKTTAVHALSYYLTSHFGIPHGHAVGLLFGWVFSQNILVEKSNCNDPRGTSFVLSRLSKLQELLGCDSSDDFINSFYQLMIDIGLNLSVIRFSTEIASQVFQSVNVERLGNNPVRINFSSETSFVDFYNRLNKKLHKRI